eukprot:g2121.t1
MWLLKGRLQTTRLSNLPNVSAGFDWAPELVSADVEEDVRVETDTLRDTLQECARLNRRAKDALRAM